MQKTHFTIFAAFKFLPKRGFLLTSMALREQGQFFIAISYFSDDTQ